MWWGGAGPEGREAPRSGHSAGTCNTASKCQIERVHMCFSVPLLCGAGCFRELGYATNRPWPLGFGEWVDWDGSQRDRAKENNANRSAPAPEPFPQAGPQQHEPLRTAPTGGLPGLPRRLVRTQHSPPSGCLSPSGSRLSLSVAPESPSHGQHCKGQAWHTLGPGKGRQLRIFSSSRKQHFPHPFHMFG